MPDADAEAELLAEVRRTLFVAAVGDALDRMGLQHQFLPPPIRAIDPAMVVLGRAMPVLEADAFSDRGEGRGPLATRPFGLLFEALDDLQPGEVYICAGASPRYALWGGLMSTRAQACRAAGAVLDGFHRDTNEVLRLGLPVFSLGAYAQDQGPRGKVVDWRTPIEFGGVRVAPGDIVYGDRDGVLIVPSACAEEAFSLALKKVRAECDVSEALRSGMTTAEAFRTFGVM